MTRTTYVEHTGQAQFLKDAAKGKRLIDTTAGPEGEMVYRFNEGGRETSATGTELSVMSSYYRRSAPEVTYRRPAPNFTSIGGFRVVGWWFGVGFGFVFGIPY